MNKIICEICGTTYQSNAAACPICGWTHNTPGAVAEDELELDSFQEQEAAQDTAQKVSAEKKNRAIFDYDAVNNGRKQAQVVAEEDTEEYVEVEEEEEPKANTFLVVLLVIVIVALLLAAGYMFVRFFLPGRAADDQKETVPAVTAEVVETMEPEVEGIPCTNIALPNGIDVLNEKGQNWLLNVIVLPEDTTDEVIFESEDESIATVDENGKVTAVAEGETNIVVTCGDQKVTCPVTVRYEAETEPEETASMPTVGSSEETKATEETKASTPDVVLKLKKDDIQFGRYGVYFMLELDCDLEQSDVEWSSNNNYVASVDNEGRVTALGPGIAKITAKYDDQEVSCIVRCRF